MLLSAQVTEFSQYRGTSPTLEQCLQSFPTSHIKIRSAMYSENFDEKLKMQLSLALQLHVLQHWRRNWLDTHCSEIGGVLVTASNSIQRLPWFRYRMELAQHCFDLVIGNP